MFYGQKRARAWDSPRARLGIKATVVEILTGHRHLHRPGITQLDKECPIGLGDVDSRLAEIIV